MNWVPKLKARDPMESTASLRRGRFWDLWFALSYPLVLGVGFFVNYRISKDGGSALGGKIEQGAFYVLSDSGKLSRTSGPEWVVSLVLGCLCFLFGVIAAVGLAYFPMKYYFLPLLRNRQERNSLLP
jgi:hypothetical protein